YKPFGEFFTAETEETIGNPFGFTGQWYDANGLLTTITDTLSRDITLSYDVNDMLEKITDFAGRSWEYTYDSNDLVGVTGPNTTDYPNGLTTAYYYDEDHNLTHIIDPNEDEILQNYYEEPDRVWKQDVGEGSYEFDYDPDNNLTKITDRENNETRMVYNSTGQLMSETVYTADANSVPNSFTISYAYNDNLLRMRTIYLEGNCVDRCALDPNSCDICDGEGNCVSTCDPNNCQICVEGNCVDRCTLDPNSCDICDGDGNCVSTCDPNCEFCCGGTCIQNYECCIDDTRVDPICDNCHEPVEHVLWECGHNQYDVNCQSDWCIKNTYSSASCDHKDPNWPCSKSNCDTVADGLKYADYQEAFATTNCPKGGDPVILTEKWRTYFGCSSCTPYIWRGACEISSCSTGSFLYDDWIGQKDKCGCPGACP
ncbi:MAG: hypothetical protein DRP74_08775, partial [Candidatus Omnitrophota bacterium]